MKNQYRQICNQRKRAIEKRLEGAATTGGHGGPVIEVGNVHYELSGKASAIHCGGIGVIHLLARKPVTLHSRGVKSRRCNIVPRIVGSSIRAAIR